MAERLGLDDERCPAWSRPIQSSTCGHRGCGPAATAYNLSVVLAGETPATPYEVLKSPRLGELLDEARRHYDYVVIDTPPIVAFPDCRILNNWVDGWLIVVAAHRTSRKLLEEALDLMEESKTVGFVFTHDERFRANARYYGAYYGARPRPASRVPGPLTTAMIATLALLDGCAILAALCAATFGWHRPFTGDWVADSRALALLLTLTLGTLIALYYADAYDLRVVPGAGPFVARLPRCVAFALVPLGAAYVFFPNAVALAAMVIVAALVALPVLRSPFYKLVHRGVFAERVLVIGTGPLARRALEAAEDQGRGRCVIVGVVDDEMDADDVLRAGGRAPGSAVAPRPDHQDDRTGPDRHGPGGAAPADCPFRPCSKRGSAGS